MGWKLLNGKVFLIDDGWRCSCRSLLPFKMCLGKYVDFFVVVSFRLENTVRFKMFARGINSSFHPFEDTD